MVERPDKIMKIIIFPTSFLKANPHLKYIQKIMIISNTNSYQHVIEIDIQPQKIELLQLD